MGGGKQTPRQKLIGMMYLFLTAMLALNVSTNVLRSFLTVNDSMVRTNRNFDAKVQSVYTMFERALAENKDKVQENFDKAQEARRLTAELREHLRLLRAGVVALSAGIPVEDAMDFDPHNIKRQDDYDTPSLYFINQGRGAELRDKIKEHVVAMYALLPEEARENIISPFDMDGPFYDNQGVEISWEFANFNRAIIVAALTILHKLENDAMNLEFDIVNELFRLIAAGDMTFDNVVARIIPKSTFVALGENFEAEVFLVAFDSRTRVTANIGGQIINSRDGIVNYTRPATAEGIFQVSGFLDLPGGDRFPFRTEYVVAAPAASVSADAMNVFYIGVDNPISTAVSGVDPSSVSVSISGAGGTITPIAGSNSKFIVRATSQGNATITLQVRTNAGTKTAGQFTYRVKRVPDPIVLANGVDEHTTIVDKNILANAGGLVARMKDFDFDLQTPVVSFTMVTTVRGDFIQVKSTSNRFTDEMTTYIRNAGRGQRIFFEDIVVRMPTGNQTMRNLVLTIR